MDDVWTLDKTTTELKRGSADYWILYVSEGASELVAGTNMYCAMQGQAVIVTMSNMDIRMKPSRDFKCNAVRIHDSASSELVRRYLHLMNAIDEPMNVIAVGKQQQNIEAVLQKMQTAEDAGSLEELLIRLYRAGPKAMAGTYSNRSEIVSNVRKRLEKEFSKEFCLSGIAAEYNMSVSYLAHLFKEITGVSIMRYLLNCRICAAKEYLAQTIIPVKEIAEKCGFNDASNFGRTFKKEMGCTPKQYRDQLASAAHSME